MLGLLGRIAASDTSALSELERDLPRLAGALAAKGFPFPMALLDVSHDLPAAHTLARIALSEYPIQGFEGSLPFSLARTRSLEVLPYLIVMLDSPMSSPRDGALTAFCQVLGPGFGGEPSSFWRPEMKAYCPMKSPMGDSEQERRDVTFWKEWYAGNLGEIRKVANLPQVVTPTRYSSPPQMQEITNIPLEQRFYGGVLSRSITPPDHYHADRRLSERTA